MPMKHARPTDLATFVTFSALTWGCAGSPYGKNGQIASGFWTEERERPALALPSDVPSHLRALPADSVIVGVLSDAPTSVVTAPVVPELPSGATEYAMTRERHVVTRRRNGEPWREVFSEAVRDWSLLHPSDAILDSGRYQHADHYGRLTTYGSGQFVRLLHRCESDACVAMKDANQGVCLATNESPTFAQCFLEKQGQSAPTLVATSKFGPLSPVEWDALRTMPVSLLAAWESAAGRDLDVRQVVGQSTRRSVLVCALLGDRTVSCWGSNAYGQRANAGLTDKLSFASIPGLANVEQLSVSNEHACARTTEGRILCWGNGARFPMQVSETLLTRAKPCSVDAGKTDAYTRERQANSDRASEACDHRCGRTDPVPRIPVYVESDGCLASERPTFVATRPVELKLGAPAVALRTSYSAESAVNTDLRIRSCVAFSENRSVCGN